MHYGNIKYCDIANGTGVRTVLFVSGCTHHCEGCFQPETWDFKYGHEFTEKTEEDIISSLKPGYIAGLTVLGGEPFEQENQKTLLPFIERVRRECPDKDIWMYSGYAWEELTDEGNKRCHTEDTVKLLESIDVLVDGEFHLKEKNLSLKFRGSANQRILDVKESMRREKPVALMQ